jgi:uncharacterized protein with von Willebrand factor type A (vWA) domain
MSDPGAIVRVVDEVLWGLRREGFTISTAQAIDAARAVRAVGLEDARYVRDALAAVVVERPRDRRRFDAILDAFFARDAAARGTFWERLAARGFSEQETSVLRELLSQLAASGPDGLASLDALLDGGADLDRALALAGVPRSLDASAGARLGYLTHAMLGKVGVHTSRRVVTALRSRLAEALGARGEALADAISQELDRAEADVRSHVQRRTTGDGTDADRSLRRAETTPFVALSNDEVEEVRRAVRRLAERLRGGARVRSRHAVRGRIDPHRTLRRALRTGGVPLELVRRSRRRDRPKLILLCDVSDSVRAAATFLLEFTSAVHELFDRTRSFVFVSDLSETTQVFATQPIRVAIARAWDLVGSGDNSNYGRALRRFEADQLRSLDRRTTVVILGDGRTNFHDPAADVLTRIRERSRALLWLCPEPRGQWGQGDSAMNAYAPLCTSVLEVRCAADLERAARALVARG